jgi:hypothetical protein
MTTTLSPAPLAPIATKYKLLVRTRNDGYIYLGNDFKLYFCDHSGDDRWDNPQGPEACEDKPSPLVIESLTRHAGKDFCGPITVKREDGYSTMLTTDVFRRTLDLIKLLRLA